MLASALIFLSIFAAAARAGKRGLCWAWCKNLTNAYLLAPIDPISPSTDDAPLCDSFLGHFFRPSD